KPVFGYWIKTTSSSQNIFYLDKQGKIYGDANTDFFPEEHLNLQFMKVSPDGKMILIKYGDLLNPTVMIFNVESKTYQILASVVSADFSPDSKQIAYLDNASPANLTVKDLTGVKQQTVKILSINIKDVDLSWPASSTIYLSSKPSNKYEGQIWSINTKTKNIALVASGNGLMASWSRGGKIGMKFTVNSANAINSGFIDSGGIALADLGFSTLPIKCVFADLIVPTSSVTIATTTKTTAKTKSAPAPAAPKNPYSGMFLYCALPQSYNTQLAPILPDDYLKRAVYFNDFIYKIGLEDSSFTVLYADSTNPIDAYDLKFSGSRLFFINRYNDKLYSLDLTNN
ncbi:MAG: hypothetical protein NTW60_02450, partial [Candidatus Wolfebacteria bacterium]|nr:hypothetical protein [Candidatus Wolfebacteria bacterium]